MAMAVEVLYNSGPLSGVSNSADACVPFVSTGTLAQAKCSGNESKLKTRRKVAEKSEAAGRGNEAARLFILRIN